MCDMTVGDLVCRQGAACLPDSSVLLRVFSSRVNTGLKLSGTGRNILKADTLVLPLAYLKGQVQNRVMRPCQNN